MAGPVHPADSEPCQTHAAAPLWQWMLGVATFFAIFALFLTNNEIRSPASIPLKSTNVATVPLFNAWTIGWNADRALHGLNGYWNAPIFYPADDSFAFSEPQPATLLVAPVCWTTGSAIAGYKAWLFLSLCLNGFFTALLLRRIGHGLFLQLVGGTAVALLPIVHQRIDVLQLVPVWGIIWFWSSLFELDKTPGRRTAAELGISYATCFALCVHHGMFLSATLPLAALVFIRRLPDRTFLTSSLQATFLAALLVLPIVAPIYAAAHANAFSRKERSVKNQSATPEQLLATPSNSLIQFSQLENSNRRRFNPGWFRMTFAVLGATAAVVWGERRRWAVFLLLTAVSATTLSLGLNLELFGWKPWQSISEHLPGFGQVRNVFRFVWLIQMSVLLLAIEGLATVLASCQQRFSKSFLKPALAIFVAIPGVILAAEVLPEEAQRGGVPDVARHKGWTQFIRENNPAGQPIVCLPFASGNSIGDFDVTTRWMLYGLEHGAPMLNGYSGFFPKSYFELRNFVNAEFPSPKVFDRFAELDVEFVVVSRNYREPEKLLSESAGKLNLVYRNSDAAVDIYRLQKR